MKGGIKIIKVALNQIKRKAKATTMQEVRFKGKHIAYEIKERAIITVQEVELRWHYIKIKLKAMRKDRVKIRINDGIT